VVSNKIKHRERQINKDEKQVERKGKREFVFVVVVDVGLRKTHRQADKTKTRNICLLFAHFLY
jgi:hypothetical protein